MRDYSDRLLVMLDMISKGEIKLFAPLPVDPRCEVEWITTAVDRALNESIFLVELLYELPLPSHPTGPVRAVGVYTDVCGNKRNYP